MEKKRVIDGTLDRLRKLAGTYNDREVCDILGIKYGTLDNWKARDSIPAKRLKEISEKFGVSYEWLDSGIGETKQIDNYNKPAANAINDVSMGYGDKKEECIVLPYHPDIYASAGGGAFNGFDMSSPVSISRGFLRSYFGISAAKGMHIINVVGDSMDPTLKNGEMIFINPVENEGFRDGGVYVIMCGDAILVKRVMQHPITKEYTLISDNPEVEDISLTMDESSDCKFVGRVVGNMGVV